MFGRDLAAAFLVLAQAGAAVTLLPPKAAADREKVCVGSSSALIVSAGLEGCAESPDVEPAAEDRLFVTIGPDGRRLTFGRIPANSGSVPKRDDSAFVQVAVSAREAPRSDCAVTIRELAVPQGTEGVWRVDIAPRNATIQTDLVLPAGKYGLSVECEDFEPFTGELEIHGGTVPQKFVGTLERIPRITGRVVGTAAGTIAQVDDESGRNLGQTAPSGEFSIPIRRGSWPPRIRIGALGYGTEVVELPSTPSVVELPEVRLEQAGTIVVSGAGENLQRIQSVDVFRVTGMRGKTAHRTFDAAELRRAAFEISRLTPGKYLVVASGAKPLEKYGALMDVTAGQVSRFEANWTDHTLELRTFIGEERLGDAEIKVESVAALWDSTVTIPAEGALDVGLWQPGELVYLLQAPKAIIHSGTVEFTPPVVTIRVPTRSVEGQVVEDLTGEPLEGVQVVLSGGGSMRQAKSGADGRFRFVGVDAGTIQLSAGGTQGFSRESMPITLSEDAQTRSVRFRLQRRRERTLEITTSRGTPAASATVFDVGDNAVLGVATTDSRGIVRLPLRQRNALIVMDGDRTVHAQVISGEAKDDEVTRVRLLDPVASVTVATEAGQGRPIEGISLAMRVNGVFFPVEMMSVLTARTGLDLRSGPDGRIRLNRLPVGIYEFWPVRSRSDIEAVLSGRPGPAPVVLNVGPGENFARLTFTNVGDDEEDKGATRR